MPQDCSKYVNHGFSAQSYCAYGSGSHRIRAHCRREDGSGFYKYGPWVGTGDVSKVWCHVTGAIIQVQGD